MNNDEWDGERCQSCGRGYRDVWATTDKIWMSVVGRKGGLRCTNCFTYEAKKNGIVVLLPEPIYTEKDKIEFQLTSIRDWAENKIREGHEPPWAWYQYMKLIETIREIQSGMGALKEPDEPQMPM